MNSEAKGEMNTNIIHVELIKKDSWEKQEQKNKESPISHFMQPNLGPLFLEDGEGQ